MFKHRVQTCTAPCNLLVQAEYQWGSKFYQEEIIFLWYHLFWHHIASSWNTTSNSAISNTETWGKHRSLGWAELFMPPSVCRSSNSFGAVGKLLDCYEENNISIQLNWGTDRTTTQLLVPSIFKLQSVVQHCLQNEKSTTLLHLVNRTGIPGVLQRWKLTAGFISMNCNKPPEQYKFHISWVMHNESTSANWLWGGVKFGNWIWEPSTHCLFLKLRSCGHSASLGIEC